MTFDVIKEKAQQIFGNKNEEKVAIAGFQFSKGWFEAFKRGFGIKYQIAHEQSGQVNVEKAQGKINEIIIGLCKFNIYDISS